MFSSIRRLIGNIKVWEDGDIIYISGLPADKITKDIYNQWATGKINTWMFNTCTKSSLSFHRFFATDVLYTLQTIANDRSTEHSARAIQQIINEMYLHTWLKDTLVEKPNILNFEKLNDLNVKLFPHQMEFLESYNFLVPKYNLKGYLLGAAPGTGKTLMSLGLSLALEADVVICIVPKNSVDKVWVDTLETRFVKEQSYFKSTSNTSPIDGKKYYIFHYEQLNNAIEFFKNKSFIKPVIVLDESHNFNEMSSLRTQSFIDLCKQLNCQHVVWASGTLVKAIGNEVIPILHTLDVYFTTEVEERFRKIFGKNASKAVDILRNRLGLITFKVDKSIIVKTEVITTEKKVVVPNGNDYTLTKIREVMSEFINKQMAYYKNNMRSFEDKYNYCISLYERSIKTKEQMALFLKYKNNVQLIRKNYDPVLMKQEVMFCNQFELRTIIPALPQYLKEDFKNVRSIIKYYQLKVQGEALGRILGKTRMQCNVDIVRQSKIEDDIDASTKKTVIFTSYVEVVDETFRYLSELGYTPLRVYGSTNKDLVNIVNKFGNDIDANPLIATFQSLSTAVPLIMANTAILMNSPFRDHEYQQACARVDRIGQDSTVNIINVLLDTGTEPNISTRSNDIMQWSKEQVAALLGIPVSAGDIVTLENFNDFIEGNSLTIYDKEQIKPSWNSW